jgi:hypothetical protein
MNPFHYGLWDAECFITSFPLARHITRNYQDFWLSCKNPSYFIRAEHPHITDLRRRVLELEGRAYIARRESYRITPEMSPETGAIIHLHAIELLERDHFRASGQLRERTGHGG